MYILVVCIYWFYFFFFSSRRRHTRCALVTGVQTCALPILLSRLLPHPPDRGRAARMRCLAVHVRTCRLGAGAACRIVMDRALPGVWPAQLHAGADAAPPPRMLT